MSIVDEYRGLPIAELISAPLIGAANAQGKLAMLTSEFIQNVGIENNKVKTVDFTYGSHDNNGAEVEKTLKVPLLSIVNIPNLSVKKAEVEFTMEVKQQTIDKSSKDATVSTEVNYKSMWSPVSAKITGTITTKSEHTRQTDKSAKYDVKVEARDDGPPEGLARILDILANNMKNGGSDKA